jgi:ABC-type branched-subunit amino acid transport system substrate-binding protein
MRTRRGAGPVAAVATAVVLALGMGGCAASDADQGGAGGDGLGVHLYGSDGNMSSAFGEAAVKQPLKDHADALAGMKGTTPLTRLTDDFKKRIRAVDPSLADYVYGAEAYDAVVIAGLAAETARTTDPTVIAKYINGVTASGTVCESVKACLGLIRDGRDIAYRGVSVRRSGFTDVGEPSTASYGTVSFDRSGHIDSGKTEYVGAGDEKNETKVPSPPPPGAKAPKVGTGLKIGGLLPHTGGLSFAGPALFAGARLGVNELNDAGGVLGQKVDWVDGDDGTSPTVAAATVDRFIAAGVDVIIGASASGVSLAVLPKVIAAGKLMISPSATSDALTKFDDHGLFFRTSPPDVLQARALTDIIFRDGTQRILIVARDDAYGAGLQHNVAEDLKSAGVKAANVKLFSYPAKDQYSDQEAAALFGPLIKAIKAFNPSGVLVISFEETAQIIKAMLDGGIKLHD